MVMSVWYLSYNLYCTGFAQTDKALYAVRGGVFGVSGDFFAEFFSASTSTMNDEISKVDATAFAANGLNATFGTNGTKEFFRQEFRVWIYCCIRFVAQVFPIFRVKYSA